MRDWAYKSWKESMVIWSRIRIPDHFSTSVSIAEHGISRDLLAYLIQSLAAFHETHAAKGLTPTREWIIQYILGAIRRTGRSEL